MKIVAMGGGDGVFGTLPIDRELVNLANTQLPRLLFIPTASDDAPSYVEMIRTLYGSLGCQVETLLLWSGDGTAEIAHEKIRTADVIYVGGGNTKKMIARWRELGVDKALAEHLEAGKPVGGTSAGAICWFRLGNSDWPQYEGIAGVNTAPLQCLNFVDLAVCPHTREEPFRLGEFREMMREVPGCGIGIDDCCAIQIEGDSYRILASQNNAFAHRIEWRGAVLHERLLEAHDDFRPLSDLKNQL